MHCARQPMRLAAAGRLVVDWMGRASPPYRKNRRTASASTAEAAAAAAAAVAAAAATAAAAAAAAAAITARLARQLALRMITDREAENAL